MSLVFPSRSVENNAEAVTLADRLVANGRRFLDIDPLSCVRIDAIGRVTP